MNGLGNGSNGEWTFLDIVTLISFVIGLQNLELNVDQNDMQNQTKEINQTADDRVNKLLTEIHSHLEEQDKKLDLILQEIKNDR